MEGADSCAIDAVVAIVEYGVDTAGQEEKWGDGER